MLGNFTVFFPLLYFFYFLKKYQIPCEGQTVWIQIRLEVLSGKECKRLAENEVLLYCDWALLSFITSLVKLLNCGGKTLTDLEATFLHDWNNADRNIKCHIQLANVITVAQITLHLLSIIC